MIMFFADYIALHPFFDSGSTLFFLRAFVIISSSGVLEGFLAYLA